MKPWGWWGGGEGEVEEGGEGETDGEGVILDPTSNFYNFNLRWAIFFVSRSRSTNRHSKYVN